MQDGKIHGYNESPEAETPGNPPAESAPPSGAAVGEKRPLRSELDVAESEVARLRAALAELGKRPHYAGCPKSFRYHPSDIPCDCGIDAHNAKVAAALEVKP